MKKKHYITLSTLIAIAITIATLFHYYSYSSRAQRFVESNIEGYNWIDKYLTDLKGLRQDFNPYQYSTLYVARDTLDSLYAICKTNVDVYPDNQMICTDSINAIISDKLELWNNSPYAKNLSFYEFCEYLLPYRAGAEELSDFSDIIRKRYNPILKQANPQNSIAAASIINDDMKTWMKFDLRSHALLSEPSVLDMMKDSLGSCRGLSALFVQIMRTMGIPAAIDECPVWAHRNSGHEWTVVRGLDGKWKPFEPAEFNPDGFRSVSRNTKSSKIYRRTYSFNHDFHPPVPKNDIPNTFKAFNRIDVTHEYVTTSDISITPEINIDQSNGVLYLAVFNTNKWVPVAWAKIEDGMADFKNIGNNDIVYLPVFYRNGDVIPAGAPFVLNRESRRAIISPNRDRLKTLDMKFQNLYFVTVFDTFATQRIGRVTELYYWNNEWSLCDRDTVNETFISHFDNVPSDGLYLIRWQDIANTWQRPFMADSTSYNSRWF